MSILKIHAREIFDSRGNPTVEVDLYTNKGESLQMLVSSIYLAELKRQLKALQAVLLKHWNCACFFLHTYNLLLSLQWNLQEKTCTLLYWDEFAELKILAWTTKCFILCHFLQCKC